MKAVSLQTCLAKVTRERDQFGDGGLSTMKAGIEARHLRHIGQSFGDGFDGCQIVRLMKGRQWNQLAKLRKDFGVQDCRPGETRSTVDDAMTDAHHSRATISRSQPHRARIYGLTTVASGNILVCQRFSVGVFNRETR